MPAVRLSNPFRRIVNVGWGGMGFLILWEVLQPNSGSDPIDSTLRIENNNFGMDMDNTIIFDGLTDWSEPGGITIASNGPDFTQDPGAPIAQGSGNLATSQITSAMRSTYFLWRYKQRKNFSGLSGNEILRDTITVINLDAVFNRGTNGALPFVVIGGRMNGPMSNEFGNTFSCGHKKTGPLFTPTSGTDIMPTNAGLNNLQTRIFQTGGPRQWNLVIPRENPVNPTFVVF